MGAGFCSLSTYRIRLIAAPLLNRAPPGNVKSPVFGFFLDTQSHTTGNQIVYVFIILQDWTD